VNDYSKQTREILDYVKAARRFDPDVHSNGQFSTKLTERLNALGLTPASYIDQLQVHPSELDELVKAIIEPKPLLQDEQAWSELRDMVVRPLARTLGPIRIWCINSGHGIEACGLALMLAEEIGVQQCQERVKIFATDALEDNLTGARIGAFPRSQLSVLDNAAIERYFETNGNNQLTFRSDLRRQIIFGKHHFLDDAPISRMDIVVCRYVLCCNDLERQQKAMSRLLFSLHTGGTLVIGRGEQIADKQGLEQIDGSSSLYRKTLHSKMQFWDALQPSVEQHPRGTLLERTAVDLCGPAQVVVDLSGNVVLANAKARTTFGITASDIGKPLQDLEISYRPLELRSLIEKVERERTIINIPLVMKMYPEGPMHFEVQLRPLMDNDMLVATSIQYLDISVRHELSHQVAAVNEHLQAANEELHAAHEELLTTNEELQSTNEELETTNEELQSMNEELETMNEELRSTNSELESANTTQCTITTKLESSNRFLTKVVGSVQSAIIVLNHNFNVEVWNQRATEIWGLNFDEVVEQNFFGLDIGFPVEALKAPLRSLAAGSTSEFQQSVAAHNRKGKSIECKVRANTLSPSSPKGFLIVISPGKSS
jgi:two-component system CheB/CheR fusion protein